MFWRTRDTGKKEVLPETRGLPKLRFWRESSYAESHARGKHRSHLVYDWILVEMAGTAVEAET